MSVAERPPRALQEDLITLLAHSDQHGKLIATMVEPALFEGDYRTIAERCIAYWREHNQAPKMHFPNLLSDILEEGDERKAKFFRHTLLGMADAAPQVNSDYVLGMVSKFKYVQQ